MYNIPPLFTVFLSQLTMFLPPQCFLLHLQYFLLRLLCSPSVHICLFFIHKYIPSTQIYSDPLFTVFSPLLTVFIPPFTYIPPSFIVFISPFKDTSFPLHALHLFFRSLFLCLYADRVVNITFFTFRSIVTFICLNLMDGRIIVFI